MNKVEMTHKLLHALIDQRDFILPSFVDSIRARPLLQVNDRQFICFASGAAEYIFDYNGLFL
jgi:hypothetical protein